MTYSINHAHLTIIFASSQHIPTLIALGPKVPMLKMIVSLDELSPETRNVLNQWGKNQGIDVKELLERRFFLNSHRRFNPNFL